MTYRIFLNDYGGNVDAFHAACYAVYQAFWAKTPVFEGLPVLRRTGLDEKTGWEKTFWGIVEGHDDGRQFGLLERYEKILCLQYMIDCVVTGDDDVKWYQIRRDGKIRVEIFSERHGFLMVLQRQSNKYFFITAHPLMQRQVDKKKANYQEWIEGGKNPL